MAFRNIRVKRLSVKVKLVARDMESNGHRYAMSEDVADSTARQRIAGNRSRQSMRASHRSKLKSAYNAFKKRWKLTRLDYDSRIGRGPFSAGQKSAIVGIAAPKEFPRAVWEELVSKAGSSTPAQAVCDAVNLRTSRRFTRLTTRLSPTFFVSAALAMAALGKRYGPPRKASAKEGKRA